MSNCVLKRFDLDQYEGEWATMREDETGEYVLFNEVNLRIEELVDENDLLRKVTHISIPTATMEQEFAKHYNQGFAAGLKRTDEIQKNISNISLNLLREIMQEGDMKFELGLNLFNKVEMWLKDNQR